MPDDADDEPTVPIQCEECNTTSRVSLSTLADAIERHNENRHDGEQVAEVDPAIAEEVMDLVAEDMGLTS